MADERPVVWAVCKDEWENNGPVAVFTTQALADEHCAALAAEPGYGANYDVRPFPLLDAEPQRVTWYHRQAAIHTTSGDVSRYEREPRTGWRYEHADPLVDVTGPRGMVVINAWATTDEAALAAAEAELARRALP